MTADDISLEGHAIQCDADPVIEPLETAFSKREPAPSQSGVTATTVVNLRSMEDSISKLDASYLIAEFAEGSCLVDIVHGWEMGRLVHDTATDARWETDGLRLLIESTRVLRDELDEGQATDEPHCERLSYRVVEGRFTRLGRESAFNDRPEASTQLLPTRGRDTRHDLARSEVFGRVRRGKGQGRRSAKERSDGRVG